MHVSAVCVSMGARYVVVEKLDDFGPQVATVWDVDAASFGNEPVLRLTMHSINESVEFLVIPIVVVVIVRRFQFFKNFFG